jgi:hypothetical protein
MVIKIQLYLKNQFAVEKEFEISDHEEGIGFEDNCELREDEIKCLIKKTEALFHHELEKVNWNYRMAVVFPSKGNDIDSDFFDINENGEL